ncbi:hypothetical protein B0J12DRAFT_674149 [Macrophomina phaseolina]|uniref:Uncharacterized protein n=1 Tax=Macrophomina phaseolina TaxID=35725 RepID=A0ABQ8G1R0_9PEZI|nr:hypothetical protein B0J12DRAFT_674149 [Macrophomina phaseolina]
MRVRRMLRQNSETDASGSSAMVESVPFNRLRCADLLELIPSRPAQSRTRTTRSAGDRSLPVVHVPSCLRSYWSCQLPLFIYPAARRRSMPTTGTPTIAPLTGGISRVIPLRACKRFSSGSSSGLGSSALYPPAAVIPSLKGCDGRSVRMRG